ncbi:MAG: hypothetical protein LBM69_02265 [Lachnospiraceae bacterium]|jgi:hypothetical protein|nr:hypothetical protein [Lachnospiraceae bacterium]
MNQQKSHLTKKLDTIVDILLFLIIWALLNGILYQLFFRQTAGGDTYPSDMIYYLPEMQGQDTPYQFPYPIFFWLGAFLNHFLPPTVALAGATAILNALAMIFLKLAFHVFLYQDTAKTFGRKHILIGPLFSVCSFTIFFVSMLLPPFGRWFPGMKHLYLGVFSGNPYHNATYLATRPFAILTFFAFLVILRNLPTKADSKTQHTETIFSWKEYLFFSISLFLTTMTKPSFTLVFVATAGIIIALRMLSAGLVQWRRFVGVAVSFLPTFGGLLYQYQGVFGGEGQGVGIGFAEVWSLYSDNILLSILLAAAFPILVLVFNLREWKQDTTFRFSWQLYLMSLVMMLFLYEKGFRKADANFSWGYMHGLFFLFTGSLILLIRQTITSFHKMRVKLVIEWVVYVLHLISGIVYFLPILRGGSYY